MVEMDRVPSDSQIHQLSSGVTITTPIQRDDEVRYITATTLPCHVTRIEDRGRESRWLRFVLNEGRNRQIRRMVEAVGLEV